MNLLFKVNFMMDKNILIMLNLSNLKKYLKLILNID